MTVLAWHGEALLDGIELSSGSAVPLHEQLYQALRQAIISGKLADQQQLPRETDLAAALGISRGTVRHAVQRLVNDGLVHRTAGRGSFVNSTRADYPLSSLTGFTQQMAQDGKHPSSRVLSVSVETAAQPLPGAKFAPSVRQLLKIARVRCSDKTPVALETLHLPFPRFAGLRDLDLDETSVYDALEQEWGVRIGTGKFVLDIALLDRTSAEALEEPAGTPVFLMQGAVEDDTGQCQVAVSSLYRPAYITFRLELPRMTTLLPSGSTVSLQPRN